ncbi:MAG: ATP synthase F0 subunit C [Syntrophales bacterium]|jgi:F-type H+-transporting ATPase subunit c|nr:ATP synthase F0 subunit C [Syntrophales bacterium]MCK9527042.1 ATP synthase F0 subunit C [Syntrophales bacterium]MDX9921833.1 ATP synthase F0 subunit C [Syntrophales bacterium]
MRKGLKGVVLCLLVLGLVMALSSFAMAAEEGATAVVDYSLAIVLAASVIGAGFAMGMGALGPGSGLGQATSGAANAVGRNPEAQGKILLTMLVGMAMTESVAIYALVIALVIMYANPLVSIIAG